jgi:hypothetical protein
LSYIQAEEEDRQKRIAASPGGLDPVEVMESLPQVWSFVVFIELLVQLFLEKLTLLFIIIFSFFCAEHA